MDHSLDLETLSTEPEAALLSIGIAAFDRDTGQLLGDFYAKIRWADAMASGHVSPSTLAWWNRQSDAARSQFFGPDAVSTQEALDSCAAWLDRVNYSDARNRIVWGNGSSFDCVKLGQAFKRFQMPTQWEFWNERDMRTVVDLAGYRKGDIPFEGTEHNALHDARHQAQVISHCIRKLTSCNATPSPLAGSARSKSSPKLPTTLETSISGLPTLPQRYQCADCLTLCLGSNRSCPNCGNCTLLPVSA